MKTENEIGRDVVDAAVKVHRALGPGLLESVYEEVLSHELTKRGLDVRRQVSIPFEYEGRAFDEGFRADLLIDGQVIVELKSVEQAKPVHRKQLLTYLKLGNKRLGFLINFGCAVVKDGIVRIVNGLPE